MGNLRGSAARFWQAGDRDAVGMVAIGRSVIREFRLAIGRNAWRGSTITTL
jgi:hypothetical protein